MPGGSTHYGQPVADQMVVEIVGPNAGEVIAEEVLAVEVWDLLVY